MRSVSEETRGLRAARAAGEVPNCARCPQSQRGSATVEFAMVLPAIIALVALISTVGAATVQQVRVVEAARAATRLAALGYPDDEVSKRVLNGISGGQLDTTITDDGVVTVRVSARGPLGISLSTELHSLLDAGY